MIEKAVDRIVKALDAALAPAPPPAPESIAAETVRRAIEEVFSCPPEDEKKLRDFDCEWVAALKGVADHSYGASKVASALEDRRQERLLASGQYDGESFWSAQEMASEFAVRQAGFKRRMLIISSAAVQIARPLCARVSSILNQTADEIEQAARDQHEKYAVAFPGSPLAARLRELAKQVMQRVASDAGVSRPKLYCPFLD